MQKGDVSTFEMLDNCSQGCFIKNNIVPRKSDIKIGLLIGANCAKALELQEVTPSKVSKPICI